MSVLVNFQNKVTGIEPAQLIHYQDYKKLNGVVGNDTYKVMQLAIILI
ncbi:hypothetical protein INT80_11330 [Gallibacterium anatis]|uniref:Uncharacterized protein n=1 Tax=Gallibacterium anatis TaxID=750 RepID=A0A930UWM6_9PAST|nr:hypothetical protein [Gallibacterium anatis]